MAPLPRQIHKILNHAMWIMPLLVAVLANRWPSVVRQQQQRLPTAISEKRQEIERQRRDISTVFAELDLSITEAAKQRQAKIDTLTVGQLRQLLLELDALPTPDDFQKQEAIYQEACQLAERLGREEGAAAVEWTNRHIPGVRESALFGWAAKQPDRVFDFITASQRAHPCSASLLMDLIDRQSHGDPIALAAVAARVPWQLFDPASERGFDDLTIPVGESQTWMDSGVARSLVERGLRVSGLFGQWYEKDPQQALSTWADWPGSVDSRTYDLEEILGPQSDSEERAKQLMQAVNQADPATRNKMAETLEQIAKNNPMLAKALRDRLPNLFPADTDNP
jgi:hypothetical protein